MAPVEEPTDRTHVPGAIDGAGDDGSTGALVALGGERYEFQGTECRIDSTVVSARLQSAGGLTLHITPTDEQASLMRIEDGRSLLWGAGSSEDPLHFAVDGSTATWSGSAERFGMPGRVPASIELRCVTIVAEGPPPGPLPVGRLLFSARPPGPPAALDLWILEAGSETPIRLTEGGGNDRQPAWGADGASAIVASDRVGSDSRFSQGLRAYAIYLVPFDGSDPVYLFGRQTFSHSPEYSPDGSKLMFHSDRSGSTQIYVVDAGAAATTPFDEWQKLTDLEFAAEGSWSPDGRRVAFSGIVDDNRDIYVLDADGGTLTRLTDHPGHDDAPDWSPDGRQIAFMSEMSGSTYDIWVMDADGGNVRQLTRHAELAMYPSWSPDGAWIAYDHQRNPNITASGLDIYVMRADGSDTVNLTGDLPLGSSSFPAWAP